ncbi:MAG: hypothetical protein N4J56_005162 [Chroococcidiopsis sp. SAG 2025]|nr:hypothetical protein [Chroococcidiopsis sp. SAG 2025]
MYQAFFGKQQVIQDELFVFLALRFMTLFYDITVMK